MFRNGFRLLIARHTQQHYRDHFQAGRNLLATMDNRTMPRDSTSDPVFTRRVYNPITVDTNMESPEETITSAPTFTAVPPKRTYK